MVRPKAEFWRVMQLVEREAGDLLLTEQAMLHRLERGGWLVRVPNGAYRWSSDARTFLVDH